MKLDFEAPKLRIEKFCDENIVTSSGGEARNKIIESDTFRGVSPGNIQDADWSDMLTF